MPNVRRALADKSGFHRNPGADLWRNTLSQIPSTFGRMAYLSALRDQNTGKYEHHGLALVFGAEEAGRALRRSHIQAFQEWINYDIEQQKADLDLYLSAVFEEKKTILETWLQLTPYRTLLPNSVKPIERRLYLADFKAMLELLKNEYAVSAPDPTA